MAKKISASVGKGGKNNQEDVKIVQELLNDFTSMCGYKKLDVDGLIGPKTLTAIKEFQEKAVGMKSADSRIDPSGDSFKTLTGGAKKAESENKKADEAEKEKEEAKKGGKDGAEEAKKESKPVVRGGKGLDKKIIGALEAVSAYFGKPIYIEDAQQQQSSVNGKALYEGWVNEFKRGEGVPGLKRNRRLLDSLTSLYNDRDEKGFCRLVDNNSRDLKGGSSNGDTVNLKKHSINSDMQAALETMFNCEQQGNLICLDTAGKNIPSKITDDMKKKWG